MTMADVKKLTDGCVNGFEFDLRHYLFHKEKEFIKTVNLDNGNKLQIRVEWGHKYEIKQNACGQSFRLATGEHVPELHFSEWVDDGGMMKSYGLGYFVPLDNLPSVKRRSTKTLQTLTKNYDTEKCLKLYEEVKHKQVNPMA